MSEGALYQHQSKTPSIEVSKLIQIQFFPQSGSHFWVPDVYTALFPRHVSPPHTISLSELETPFPHMSFHISLQDKF